LTGNLRSLSKSAVFPNAKLMRVSGDDERVRIDFTPTLDFYQR
jgi:hypothetical protein